MLITDHSAVGVSNYQILHCVQDFKQDRPFAAFVGLLTMHQMIRELISQMENMVSVSYK